LLVVYIIVLVMQGPTNIKFNRLLSRSELFLLMTHRMVVIPN